MTTVDIREEGLRAMGIGRSVSVIDRLDGDVLEFVTFAEAAGRLALYHIQPGQDGGSLRRQFQRELEAGVEHSTAGCVYRRTRE